ncbi:unnamed protein product [Penicillium roqueforti FM164]|uniref:Genomic scaffold, ProqFM164S04 n=1 Tax=Penicillium roqueforti (strain FM164) TaxID=1365484 RepID=W6QGZ7_PENRF|nr:unnamed protein product [Penicillium roqueforti FM164]
MTAYKPHAGKDLVPPTLHPLQPIHLNALNTTIQDLDILHAGMLMFTMFAKVASYTNRLSVLH